VRPPRRNQLENRAFARGHSSERFQRLRERTATGDGVATELPEVRQEEIQRGPVALPKTPVWTIELEASTVGAARIEPQSHHVLDAEGTGELLVQLEPMELARRQEVRIQPRPVGRAQHVLASIAPFRLTHLP